MISAFPQPFMLEEPRYSSSSLLPDGALEHPEDALKFVLTLTRYCSRSNRGMTPEQSYQNIYTGMQGKGQRSGGENVPSSSRHRTLAAIREKHDLDLLVVADWQPSSSGDGIDTVLVDHLEKPDGNCKVPEPHRFLMMIRIHPDSDKDLRACRSISRIQLCWTSAGAPWKHFCRVAGVDGVEWIWWEGRVDGARDEGETTWDCLIGSAGEQRLQDDHSRTWIH
eukprot:746076-Hanusia_phi.AAC.4